MDPWVVLRRLKQIMDCKIACMPPYIFKGNKTGPGRPTEAIGQNYDANGPLAYDPNNIKIKEDRKANQKNKVEQAHQVKLDTDRILMLNKDLDKKSQQLMNKQDKVDAALAKSQQEKEEADKQARPITHGIMDGITKITNKSKVDESDNDKVATPLDKDDSTKTKLLTTDPVGTVPKVLPPVDTDSTVATPTATTPTATTKLAQSGGYQMPSYNDYDAIY